MKRTFRTLSIMALAIMTYVLLSGSCLPKVTIAVNGLLFGRELNTTVDDILASKMLTNPQDNNVLSLFDLYKERNLDTETLAEITKKYSADVATLYFLQKTYQSEANKVAQDLYLNYLENQVNNISQEEFSQLQTYHIVFVPGLAYKEDTTTGADFARQRRLLTQQGIKNELIEVGEWDLAEDNAQVIATQLKMISQHSEKIIVVSASKGGLETAIALGKILKPEETTSIKSWINVGGILRGSPIADAHLTFPKCWLAEIMLWTKGKKMDLVQDISYESRKEYFKQLQFPKNIKIISFVGAPLATKINKEIKSRYCSMIKLGPNDGLTPLADETIAHEIVVSEVGLDHYFRDKNIDKKTLALALVAVKMQE
jgi:hypothetical protein